jgi:hypothetical protein
MTSSRHTLMQQLNEAADQQDLKRIVVDRGAEEDAE